MHVAIVVNGDIEVADHITCEVIARELIEQFVLVDGVGGVDEHKHELRIPLIAELFLLHLGAVREYLRASAPNLTDVELSAVKGPASLHAIDNHSRHGGDLTCWEFGDQRVKFSEAGFAVSVVEFSKCSNEHELVPVGSCGEAVGRDIIIGYDDIVFVGLESVIGSGIKRILKMYAITRILHIVGVREQCRPLTVGIFLFQLRYVCLSRLRPSHP